jgi:hypothetical protein
MTLKQSDRVLNGLVGHPLGRKTEIPKVPHQDHVDSVIFFASQVVVHKQFILEGKTVNAEYYKAVMNRLLTHIHRVRPAVFCSRDFVLLHDNAPAHDATRVRQFLTPQNVTALYHSRNIQTYLRQIIFFSPRLK